MTDTEKIRLVEAWANGFNKAVEAATCGPCKEPEDAAERRADGLKALTVLQQFHFPDLDQELARIINIKEARP